MAALLNNKMDQIVQILEDAQAANSVQTQPTTPAQSPYSLAEYAKAKGYQDVSYDSNTGNYSINGQQVNQNLLTGLNKTQNKLYGTEDQYAQILNQYNLDAGEGQYISPYAGEMDKLYQELEAYTPYQTPEETQQYLSSLLQSAAQSFSYDASQDASLAAAMQDVADQGLSQAASKGTLYSGGTIANIARGQGALIPQYEQQAYSRFIDERNREIQMATTIMEWDQIQYDRNQDQLQLIQTKFDFMLNLDQQEFQKFQLMLEQRNFEKQLEIDRAALTLAQKQQQIETQWARVDSLGYVDNQASIVLGVKVGTKAQWVQQMEADKKNQLALQAKEYENQKALAIKQQAVDKSLANYKNKLDEAAALKVAKKEYEYNAALANKQQALAAGSSSQSFTSGVIGSAQKMLGLKYVWGGTSTSKGMDCSGLTQWAMKQNGVNLPRTAYEQSKVGAKQSWSSLQPGDLVFFDTVAGNGKNVDHVGIYLGNGQMLHASSGQGKVITANINTNYWKDKFTVGRRMTPGSTSSSSSSSSSGSSSSTPTLKSGSKGSSVKLAQQKLIAAGYKISADGAFGPKTKAAVIAFQKSRGLTADGIIGKNTWAALNTSKKASSSSYKTKDPKTWTTADYYAYKAAGGK